MKKFLSILGSLLIAGVVLSQTQSIVTINTTGNRNKQLVVDSRTYTITNTGATEEQAITINDLAAGQHSLDVVRVSQFNNRTSTKTYFTVREGYDLTITINSNGAVSTAETRHTRGSNANAGKPITTAAFNRLYTQAKAKTSSSARSTFLANEFTNTNKRFTANQAKQLIQLVNSESMRLNLAKQSYARITDRQNFSVVSNLLNSSANRTALNNYVATLDLDDDDYAASDLGAPMTAQQFNTIYSEVYAETNSGERDYYLRNFFSKDYNFYTSAQAAQLIRLVPGEEERFNLAKAAYRGTTDKESYGTVSQLLNNVANRSALSAYISSYNNTNGNNNNVVVAMSATDFDRLYQTVYYQSTSARYSSIYTAFTTQGNYFTVAQAKKIIPLVTSESSRLALAKAAYPALVDRSNYAQFNEFLYSSASETDLYNYVLGYTNNTQTGGYGMNETEYNTLYQNVNSSWNQASRISLLGDAFSYTNRFTVDQVRQLILLVSTESDRLVLAKNAYDNVVDKTYFSRLYDLFTYASYRNDLANFVASNGGTGTGVVRVAMTESEYNSLYNSVKTTFGFGSKMSVLTETFNKETNYFTVEQAKQLIRLVSDEDNRLTLAKASYNNIVDVENFGNIYDIFSSQSSKDELKVYVNSNVYIN